MLNNSISMTQTELLQVLTDDCRYDKMMRPPGEVNTTDPINVYTSAYIYTIKSNMVKTLVVYVIIILYFISVHTVSNIVIIFTSIIHILNNDFAAV